MFASTFPVNDADEHEHHWAWSGVVHPPCLVDKMHGIFTGVLNTSQHAPQLDAEQTEDGDALKAITS